MFLQRLTIENLRSVRGLELDFRDSASGNRKWTILLGENGTGKSTILRAAALVLCGSDALPTLMPDPRAWVRVGSKTARIEATVATAGGETRRFALEVKANETISDVVKRNDKNLQLLDRALAHSGRNYFVAGYGVSRRLPSATRRHGPKDESHGRRSRVGAVASLFSGDADLWGVDDWAIDLHYRRNEGGLTLVRSAMEELLPSVNFKGIDRERKQLLFRTPDGDVPLQQLSDGYQNMAAWCGDLLFRITDAFHDHKGPLNARGLLLVDEIDLHLHPVWQRQLLRFVEKKLPNFQILATTHSPFTAQQASVDALHVLERSSNAKAVTVRQFRGDPKTLRVEQLLEPLLGLETAESLETERARSRVRQLKAKGRRSPADKKELAGLTESLASLQRERALDPEERKRLDLLARIEVRLNSLSTSGTKRLRRRK